MKMVSWNVNGVRSAVQKGLLEYLSEESPDIFCMQEVKAGESEFPAHIEVGASGYRVFWNAAERKGYS